VRHTNTKQCLYPIVMQHNNTKQYFYPRIVQHDNTKQYLYPRVVQHKSNQCHSKTAFLVWDWYLQYQESGGIWLSSYVLLPRFVRSGDKGWDACFKVGEYDVNIHVVGDCNLQLISSLSSEQSCLTRLCTIHSPVSCSCV